MDEKLIESSQKLFLTGNNTARLIRIRGGFCCGIATFSLRRPREESGHEDATRAMRIPFVLHEKTEKRSLAIWRREAFRDPASERPAGKTVARGLSCPLFSLV
jgi:hypothetical protein